MSLPPLGGPDTAHVIIDMQRLFAEQTVWHTPAVTEILPKVRRLAEGFAGRNHFAKFMLPPNPEAASGRWQQYYRSWEMLTTDRLDPAMQDVVPALADLVEPARLIEKPTYSIFKVAGQRQRMEEVGIRTLVFSGVETDVCVLAGLMEAVDAGFHTVVATDAVGSSEPASHRAVLDLVLPRMPDQIELLTVEEILIRMSAQ